MEIIHQEKYLGKTQKIIKNKIIKESQNKSSDASGWLSHLMEK